MACPADSASCAFGAAAPPAIDLSSGSSPDTFDCVSAVYTRVVTKIYGLCVCGWERCRGLCMDAWVCVILSCACIYS